MTIALKANAAGTQGEILLNGNPVVVIDAGGIIKGVTPVSYVRAASGPATVGANFTAFPSWTKQEEINGGTLQSGGAWFPPVAGIYQINYTVNFASSGVSAASIQAQLRKSGNLVHSSGQGSDAAIFPIINGSILLNLTPTEYIDVGALLNAGTALNVTAGFNAALVRNT